MRRSTASCAPRAVLRGRRGSAASWPARAGGAGAAVKARAPVAMAGAGPACAQSARLDRGTCPFPSRRAQARHPRLRAWWQITESTVATLKPFHGMAGAGPPSTNCSADLSQVVGGRPEPAPGRLTRLPAMTVPCDRATAEAVILSRALMPIDPLAVASPASATASCPAGRPRLSCRARRSHGWRVSARHDEEGPARPLKRLHLTRTGRRPAVARWHRPESPRPAQAATDRGLP